MRIRTRRIRIRRNRTRSHVVPRSLVLALLLCLLIGGALSSVAAAAATVGSATEAGSNLVVWGGGVEGAFVAPDGTAGPTFSIGAGHSPTTATDGTDHLVVWHHNVPLEGCSFREASSIMGAIVRSDATVSVPFTIASWNGPCEVSDVRTLPYRMIFPRAGFDGTNYFVVWQTSRLSSAAMTIDGARVTPDGTVLDPGGATLVATPLRDSFAHPRLAFDGTNFLVVYLAGEDFHFAAGAHGVFATRVNTLSAPVALDPAGIPISDPIRRNDPDVAAGAVAFDGLNWVVTWFQTGEQLSDSDALMAARVTSAGAVLDPRGVPVVSEPNEDVDELAIASDGANLFVVLYNSPDSSSQAVLIDSTSTGFEIVKPLFSVPLEHPDAGLSASGFLVVGERPCCAVGIDGVRITAQGEVLDPQPFPISGPDTTPPETTITSSPPAVSNSTTATFEFGADEGARFECRVDSEPFAGCSSPMTFNNLAEGNHTFEVFARDSAGNVDATPATWSWTIDLSAPDTSISSGPPSLTNETTATFAFGSSETDATFECSLDGAAFSGCSSPATYA